MQHYAVVELKQFDLRWLTARLASLEVSGVAPRVVDRTSFEGEASSEACTGLTRRNTDS